ncbi:MAG: hypothetical protein DRH11_04840 [Deltaproteobacteria bacterium]|nr:MAG: hypothetical protein DRH11_04840 [Deltaproteobacteria bacterium]
MKGNFGLHYAGSVWYRILAFALVPGRITRALQIFCFPMFPPAFSSWKSGIWEMHAAVFFAYEGLLMGDLLGTRRF